jgi:hypothetical protein
VERIAAFTIVATAVAVLAVLVATAVYAQDKYSLKSPSGIAFSDFGISARQSGRIVHRVN